MSEEHITQFPDATAETQAIEERRALLRQALAKQPHNPRLKETLRRSLTPPYVRKAAQRGVFICYAREDELFALDLTTDLRDAGVSAFLDEIDISDEMEWGQQVGNALRNCGVLLLVLSPDALHDGEVQGERLYFLKTGKVVVPVLARACNLRGQQLVVQPIDFEADYQIGLRQLIPLLIDPSETASE